MLQSHKLIATISLLSICSSTNTMAQSWSQWEQQNSVGQHKAFLVIKQPGEGFCYVKQSHDSDTTKMELRFKGNAPVIITPYRGIDGDVQYWVDDNPKWTVTGSEIDMPNSIELVTDVVTEMKAGQTLYVYVKPSGMPERTQGFSLSGFTAAARALNGPECREGKGDTVSSSLGVTLKRNSSGGVVVSGKTSLPDGMILMVSLRASSGGYFAQDKVKVRSGSYETAGFTSKGSALPTGKYKVSITSPLMSLQPQSVKQKLGSSGGGIPKDIREKSSFSESYTVKHSASIALE